MEKKMDFDEFLYWEKKSLDCVDFKKIYVDIADDLIAGLILSDIIYWYLSDKTGKKNKLRVFHDGKYWIARSYKDWWNRVRITEAQAERGIRILVEKGIIEKHVYKFNGDPTCHIRLNKEKFIELFEQIRQREEEEEKNEFIENQDCQVDSEILEKPNNESTIISSKSPSTENNFALDKSPLTETSSEITSKNTTEYVSEEPLSQINYSSCQQTQIEGKSNYIQCDLNSDGTKTPVVENDRYLTANKKALDEKKQEKQSTMICVNNFPPNIRPLAQAFIDETPWVTKLDKKDEKDWIQVFTSMLEKEISPITITRAIQTMHKQGLNIVSPKSIAKMALMENNRKQNNDEYYKFAETW